MNQTEVSQLSAIDVRFVFNLSNQSNFLKYFAVDSIGSFDFVYNFNLIAVQLYSIDEEYKNSIF